MSNDPSMDCLLAGRGEELCSDLDGIDPSNELLLLCLDMCFYLFF